MPPMSAWWPREATQNRMRGSWVVLRECTASRRTAVCSLPRLRGRGGGGGGEEADARARGLPPPCPSPAGGGGDARAAAPVRDAGDRLNTGVQTVRSGIWVPPL